ncbi:hypothetical protein [Rhizobium tumorigenes]|uniref:Uncharacterized protein n=1 Tax=Rhizobium tumorigenes TaxID=2041385 RepID=A0AAF1KBW1_9HYPH|nr:hypothetical protein [Rhizobium tumorigenes]WFR97111.1 hypothetical protein PR017_08410 [Rhizobium tumorigenes]
MTYAIFWSGASEDDALNLAFALNQEFIENNYILPKIESILVKARSTRSVKGKMALFFPELSVRKIAPDEEFKLFFSINDDSGNIYYGSFLFFIRGKYGLSYLERLVLEATQFIVSMPANTTKGGGRGVSIEESSYEANIHFDEVIEADVKASPFREMAAVHVQFLRECRNKIEAKRKIRRSFLAINFK